jgi:hypothetical protein
MPEGGAWQGRWFSVQYGDMTMCQTGSQIVGTYEKDSRTGTFQGTVQGDLLRFQWREEREMVVGRPNVNEGRGYFQYIVGDDSDHYAVGEWGFDNAELGGGPWRARRLRVRGNSNQRLSCQDLNPDRSGSGTLEFEDGRSGSSGGSAPASQRPEPQRQSSDNGLLDGLD